MLKRYNRRSGAFIAAFVFFTLLACTYGIGEMRISLGPPSPTPTATRTPRPTITLIPSPTDTPIPTDTATPLATATATRRLSTPRPPTPRPLTAAPQPTSPPASTYEYHVNPSTCAHAGQTYIKGTVYLSKTDTSQRYNRAIVVLGPPDGSRYYEYQFTNENGEYTFILGDAGKAHPGNWGVWLTDPSLKRKSDIGGPIVTNDLPPDNPNSCWGAFVDFWK